MENKKNVLIGTVALAGIATSPAQAQDGEFHPSPSETANFEQFESSFAFGQIPCQAKNPKNCPKNPLPKNPRPPVPKNPGHFKNSFNHGFNAGIQNVAFKNDIQFKNPPVFKNGRNFEINEALQCLHFVQAHLTNDGLVPVSDQDVELAENCLEVFAQGLLR